MVCPAGSKKLARRGVHQRTVSRRQLAVGALRPRRHAHALHGTVLVPHVHRVAGGRALQHRCGGRRFEEIAPAVPVDGIEARHVEHLEAVAARARHQRRVLGATDRVQGARDDARPIVAPVAAVEAALELAARAWVVDRL